MPVKGTRPRGEDGLADSEKDAAEHVMIVDLERNDLSRVCEPASVRWPELMAVRGMAGVEHMVSTVEGRLREDVGLAELLEATFPGGSVTGAPKISAIDHIAALEPDEPVVHADDEAFLRGRGAFETTRVYAGKPFRLAEHLDRLAESVRRLGLPPVDRSEIEGLVRAALDAAAAEEASLRVYYTPGREGRDRPLSLAMVGSLPPGLEEMRERGIGLISVPLGQVGPAPLGGGKSTSYAVNMGAVHDAKRPGGDDPVFLPDGGVVLEGPTTNVWWRQGEELFTPALELGVLAGVTR